MIGQYWIFLQEMLNNERLPWEENNNEENTFLSTVIFFTSRRDYINDKVCLFISCIYLLILNILILQVFLQDYPKHFTRNSPSPLQVILFVYGEWHQHLRLQSETKIISFQLFYKTCSKYFARYCRYTTYH